MIAIKTVIADKQRMFVQALIQSLNSSDEKVFEVLDTVVSAEKLVERVEESKPELVIMDLNLVDEDGLSVLPRLRNFAKGMKICVLTEYGDYKFVKEAMIKGADGYILKSNSLDDFNNCIRTIFNGETFIAPGLHITPPKLKSGLSIKKSIYEDRFMIKRKLTSREQEVLALITQAKNNKEIADELYISDQTVGVHRKNIMRKLGVRNTVNLVKFALENQLV
jgi:DNA-binding NarL/FixJ family response regulator